MKKILSVFLGGALLAASLGTTSAATVSVSDFSDMPNDWSTTALTSAVENGLLAGSDGKILPKNYLTRAQMATIIVRAFAAISKGDMSAFTDVGESNWYFEYMQKAVAMGVFTGDGSGLLTPEENITREQVFVVLARAFGLTADNGTACLDKFSDKDDIASWAAPYAAALVENGYVNGSDGRLNPKSYITRAEFAQIMYNIVSAYIDNNGQTISGEYKGCVIVRASNVTVSSTAKIGGTLVVCENASGVRIEDKTRVGAILDSKNSAVYGKANGTTTDSTGTGSNTTQDEIFWIVDDGNGSTKLTDDDDGIWSEIYRP